MRAQPAGRHRHDAAQPQLHAVPAAGHQSVPAPPRARHQQQPVDARARLRGAVTAHHAGRQEQSDRRRRVPQGVRLRRPPQGAQHQRQSFVALSPTAAVRHHSRVPVHGQQQSGRDTQRHQQTHQVRRARL